MTSNSFKRRASLILAALLSLPLLLIELGTFVPRLPLIGVVGTIVSGCFSLPVSLIACLAMLAALAARRAGALRSGKYLLALTSVLLALSLVPIALLLIRAHESATPISWWSHVRVRAPAASLSTRSFQYASIGGKSLFLDVYPGVLRGGRSPAVMMVHGGGFAFGKRSDGRDWDQWFAEQGYTVFDVDYRLTPPASWNFAAPDVACALTWVRTHTEELNLDAGGLLIVGQSAGASLALQVAYGLRDGSVQSSCGGESARPSVVFALYPVEDFTLAWNEDPKLGPLALRQILSDFLGGPPQEFPDRYRAVSPIEHITPGLPPTLIAYGSHDHLVPVDGHQLFASKLRANSVRNSLIEIPWGDHGYDLAWGSLGGQITRHELSRFLAEYYPTPEASAQP